MKKMNKKGFTLAELLIVVAIIAVLVAIAIPVFNKQLEKSKAATDLANIRSGYADVVSAYLTGDIDFGGADTKTATLKVDGTAFTGTGDTYKTKGASANADATATVGSLKVNGTGFTWSKNQTITYTINSAGAVTSISGS